MKITIKTDRKVSKEYIALAEDAVKRLLKNTRNWAITNNDDKRCTCDRCDGYFDLKFSYAVAYEPHKIFATGKATIEATE